RSKSFATWPTDRSPRWHSSTISALNSGVNERRRRGFFPMLSMIGHPSGGEPLMMDVRQSGSGPVRRARLIERLEREVSRPVVSVVASAGYGKTTLLAQWAERSGQAVAWVSVDEQDNDPKVLLGYVSTPQVSQSLQTSRTQVR